MMGREVRRVPADWKHPQHEKWERYSGYIPLYGSSYAQRVAEWDEAKRQWDSGFVEDWAARPGPAWKAKDLSHENCPSYEDWDSPRPVPEDYMPDWPDVERTHYMMYEDTTEGTPISPAFATPEELARWLADTGASSLGRDTANYEEWLSVCKGGWAPSMVMMGGSVVSGVKFMASADD